MDILYTIAQYVVISEFSLIIIVILMTLALKVFFDRREISNKKTVSHIKDFLKKSNPDLSKFNKDWINFDLLMPIVNEFEQEVDSHWENLRIEFFKKILLPLARTEASDKNWTQRFCAARSFSLYFEANDEPYILMLANDQVPLIRYNSIVPAVLFGSEKCIDFIIDRMAAEPWISQFIYLREFYNASGTSRIYIENRLINSTDPKIRYVCYKLLINYPALGLSWNYNEDINSSNTPLKLASLVYLSHADRETAIPLLRNLLKDKNWQVKVISLICLRNLKDDHAIHDISDCLSSSNDTVALVAKEVLHELGDKGAQALKSHNITYKPTAFDLEKQIMQI